MKPAFSASAPVRTRPWPAWPAADHGTEKILSEVLSSGRWAISGPNTGTVSWNRRFEEAFAGYHDVPYCVAVANGSSAIRIALESLGVGWGHEVLVPGLTWVACASAVAAVGAVPILVDVDPRTLSISAEAAAQAITDQTRAMLVVHAYCTVADIDRFAALSAASGVPIVEDCSQAHGAIYRGRRVGTFGRIGVFSMQQTKVLTSGEGGAAITADPVLYDRLQQLRADGRRWVSRPSRGELDIEESGGVQGHNYGLTEFQCAILVDRLEHLDEENEKRFENAQYLDALLRKTGCLRPLDRPAALDRPTYYQYCVRVDRSAFGGQDIQSIGRAVQAELNLPVGPVYRPISQSPLYNPLSSAALPPAPEYRERFEPRRFALPVSERARAECLAFPHAALLGTRADMDDIARAFVKVQQETHRT